MILATASFLLAASKPSLAFVARFYKTGSQKSQFELYVSDFDGGNRKTLKTTLAPNFVQWVGSDRLLWTTDKGLYTSLLSPWKPVAIKDTEKYTFRESRWRSYEPGRPELLMGFDESKGIFALNTKTLRLDQVVKSPNHQEIPLNSDTATEVQDPSNPNHKMALKQYEPLHYWVGDHELVSDWDALRAYRGENDSLFFGIGTHDSTTGDRNGLMLFQKGKKPRTIFESANAFDFWQGRSQYAYCSGRDMASLGTKEVWTSQLHVGDWKKGTDKIILKGLVWVPSVSIRP